MLDLTPFGFTPTEGHAYAALLELGPSSGYAVGKALAIARANAYQALDGLVTKGAAALAGDDPRLYRAVSPTALYTSISQSQMRHLTSLEKSLQSLAGESAPVVREFDGERQLNELILRTATRATGGVLFLGPPAVALQSGPIWRKRKVEDLATVIWIVGDDSPALPIEPSGTVAPSRAEGLFGTLPVALVTDEVAVLGRWEKEDVSGLWSSDPLMIGSIRGAIEALTT